MIDKGTKIAAIESFVKQYMSNYDCSHDWLHVQRVRRLARELAMAQSTPVDLEVVDLAALLHDVGDPKYSKESARELIHDLMTKNEYPLNIVEKVCFIVENVSFRKELELIETGRAGAVYEGQVELCCVQDADRLEALGAIGVARCLAFSGAKNRPIYDPEIPPITVISASEYNKQTAAMNGTALNHFHEKLLLLESMIKTERGRELAKPRCAFIRSFIDNLKAECDIQW